jgi:uncharacterized protein involved in response to NO
MQKTKGYFLSQPHQPFFTLAIVNAIMMMLLFLLSYKGVFTLIIDPFSFHAYAMLFTLFTPFFLGFLLTTFPRFSQTPAIGQQYYTTIFWLLLLGIGLFLLGISLSKWLMFIGILLILSAQLYAAAIFYQIYKSSPLQDKHDQFWIQMAWVSGIFSNILFLLAFFTTLSLKPLAVLIGVYLYLLMMALSVGQRMIPFFSHVMVKRNSTLLKTIALLLALKILFDLLGLKVGFLFLLIAGAILVRELRRWNLPFKQADAILWILHLAIFWLPVALIIGGLSELAALIFEKNFLSLTIHLIVLGFLTTIMIGFGTRVTIGHSGNQMRVDTYTKVLFYLTQIILYFRAIYSFSGSNILFDITATLWMAMLTAWAVKYFPLLISGKKLS